MTTITASVSDALADLARSWGGRDSTERAGRLSSLVHPFWEDVPPVALMDAWEDYVDAVLRQDDLSLDWHDYPDTCACQIDVELLVGGWVDEALKTLADGPRRGAERRGN